MIDMKVEFGRDRADAITASDPEPKSDGTIEFAIDRFTRKKDATRK